jgi:hypothetical protein
MGQSSSGLDQRPFTGARCNVGVDHPGSGVNTPDVIKSPPNWVLVFGLIEGYTRCIAIERTNRGRSGRPTRERTSETACFSTVAERLRMATARVKSLPGKWPIFSHFGEEYKCTDLDFA